MRSCPVWSGVESQSKNGVLQGCAASVQTPSSKYCFEADRQDFRRLSAGMDVSSVRLSRMEISWNFDGCIRIEMSDASVKAEPRPNNERVRSVFETIVAVGGLDCS